MRQRANRDANHNEIVDIFENLGCSWQELSGVAGALDGLLGVAGVDQRVEIKDGSKVPSKRKLTPQEVETFQEWRGRTPVVVETSDDAIELVNQLRKEACFTGRKTPKQ